MRLFITGTDTNIGKTTVSRHLCRLLKAVYWKPIQTGEEKDSSSMFAETIIHPEVYHFKAPLSPHTAAALENQEIDLNTIVCPDYPSLIVEGAGGVFVPLNRNHLMIDLIQKLNLPVIVVAYSRLGTINHTLLTLHALKKANVLGVILCGKDEHNIHEQAIERYGKIQILGRMKEPHKLELDLKKLILNLH